MATSSKTTVGSKSRPDGFSGVSAMAFQLEMAIRVVERKASRNSRATPVIATLLFIISLTTPYFSAEYRLKESDIDHYRTVPLAGLSLLSYRSGCYFRPQEKDQSISNSLRRAGIREEVVGFIMGYLDGVGEGSLRIAAQHAVHQDARP